MGTHPQTKSVPGRRGQAPTPFLDKFEKIRIKVGLVLVAISEKAEYID